MNGTRNDDRRYMTFEMRAAEGDSRFVKSAPKPDHVPPVCCSCGKTVYVDGFGTRTGNTCPRRCEG